MQKKRSALRDKKGHNLRGLFCSKESGSGFELIRDYAYCPICKQVFKVETKAV